MKPRNDAHRFGECLRGFEMSDSPKPQGYGHDAKGRAGGKSAPDGGPNITHTQPIGMVGGEGRGPKTIQFELDRKLVGAPANRQGKRPQAGRGPSRRDHLAGGETAGPRDSASMLFTGAGLPAGRQL